MKKSFKTSFDTESFIYYKLNVTITIWLQFFSSICNGFMHRTNDINIIQNKNQMDFQQRFTPHRAHTLMWITTAAMTT